MNKLPENHRVAKRDEKNARNAGIAGGSAEVVGVYGAAAREHVIAYSGNDNEAGTHLVKSLKSISEERVNPDFARQNLKQQAGFSAEVKEVSKTNAEQIISGSELRKVRADEIGRVNDPLVDHLEKDSLGNIIEGSGTQMKFVGSSPKEAFDLLASKKYEKYYESETPIEVPYDRYDGILLEADKRVAKLQSQMDDQLAKGNTEAAHRLKQKIEDCETIKRSLRKSNVSTDEAMFARTHPLLSTAKDIAGVSHKAGIQTARMAGVVGGSVSIVKNLVAVVRGEIEPGDAVFHVVKDTAVSSAVGYGTGFFGTAIKGIMQNSGSQTVRALSKTNLPAVVVTVAISASTTLVRYFNQEISGVECLEELGEQGTGMISSSLFAMIGQVAIPIPVVGGIIGGMLGYALASASYGVLLESLNEEKHAHAERLRIERVCEEHIELIKSYRLELEEKINEYFLSSAELFHMSFNNIKESLSIGDVDGFISGANAISEALGRETQFSKMSEFEALMGSDTVFTL